MKIKIKIAVIFFSMAQVVPSLNAQPAGNGLPLVVNAKDFGLVGDGVADDTAALQKAINAAAGKILYIPKSPVKYKTNPLFLVSNLRIVFAPGTIIEANKGYRAANYTTGNKFVDYDCVLSLNNVENVFIEGNGSTIQMLKKEYTTGEHRHCMHIGSSKHITVADLVLKDSGGDGICISTNDRHGIYDIPSEDIYIRGVRCINNRRQGISVCSVKGLLIENSEFRDTNGTSPEAGIDIEIEHHAERGQRIVIKNCLFSGNRQHGIQIYCVSLFQDVHSNKVNNPKESVDITVEDCRFIGPMDQFDVYGVDKDVNGPNTGQVRGRITVRDCFSHGTNGAGFNKFGSQIPLYLERCTADHFGLYNGEMAEDKDKTHARGRVGFGIYGSNTVLTDCRTLDTDPKNVSQPNNRWDIGVSSEYWKPNKAIGNIEIRNFHSDLYSSPRIMVWDQGQQSETNIDEVSSLSIRYDLMPIREIFTTTYQLTFGEAGKKISTRSAEGPVAIKLPRATAVGAKFHFIHENDSPLSLTPWAGDKILGVPSPGPLKIQEKGVFILECVRTGLWTVSGNKGS